MFVLISLSFSLLRWSHTVILIFHLLVFILKSNTFLKIWSNTISISVYSRLAGSVNYVFQIIKLFSSQSWVNLSSFSVAFFILMPLTIGPPAFRDDLSSLGHDRVLLLYDRVLHSCMCIHTKLLTNRWWLLMPTVVRVGLGYAHLTAAIFAITH